MTGEMQGGLPTIAMAQVELDAIEKSLPEVGKLVGEIGMDKPFSAWSRDEVLRLMFTTVNAYRHHMRTITADDCPF